MPQPLYLQIADDLEEQIKSGDLEQGSQLSTEDDLREQYRASRNTVRDAIKRLVSQGLVETRPGQGTFVTIKVDPFVTILTGDPRIADSEGVFYLSGVSASRRKPFTTKPRVEVQTAPEEITRRLRVPSGTQFVSRHEQRYIDDLPWSLQTSFYPMEFVTGGATRLLMAQDITQGAVHYLAETIGLKQIGYRDWITARRPDSSEQRFFRIPHDSMVFEIFRTGFDQHKKPMRVTVTVFPADRNQFILDVGDDLPDPRYDDLLESEPDQGEDPHLGNTL